MMRNSDKPGAFARKGTDVTKIPNKIITRKWFDHSVTNGKSSFWYD